MKRAFITTDLDWASEAVISRALKTFASKDVPLTIFQTHRSGTVLAYAESNPCELEWHPNFMEGSSHGETVDEIISALSDVPSERRVIRCHLYFRPEDRYREFLEKTGIEASSNDLSLLSHKPSYDAQGIKELPLFFEDGCFIKAGHRLSTDTVLQNMEQEGDYVFLFHPIHVAFNSLDYALTRMLKDGLSRQEYANIPEELIDAKRNDSFGIADLFAELIDSLRENGFTFHLLKEAIDD